MFKLILKGFFIGIGKIIPGVSGGMIAIALNLYDKGIDAINNFFKDIKKNSYFLGSLGIGIILAIVFFSKIISFLLDNFYLPTMLLFVGLIMGGILPIYKNIKVKKDIKNILLALVIFIIIMTIPFIQNRGNVSLESVNLMTFLVLILIGIIDAATMVIPGISGTAILMILGYYQPIINTFSHLTDFSLLIPNFKILFPFGIGLLIGVLIFVKIMDYLFKNHELRTYYIIFSLSLSSLFLLLIQTLKLNYNVIEIIVGLIFLIIGYFISKKLEE